MNRYRCPITWFFMTWAWAVYAPSLGLAAAGLSHEASIAGGNMFSRTFVVADWMSPQAKLALGALIALGLWFARALTSLAQLVGASMLAAVFAMAADLALLPAGWSRGFGGSLTGLRFDPATLPYYLGGAAIGGGLGAASYHFCRTKSSSRARD